MKRPINITFTKSGSPQVYGDTISVECDGSPLLINARVKAALNRKLRKFTRTPAVLVSWSVI